MNKVEAKALTVYYTVKFNLIQLNRYYELNNKRYVDICRYDPREINFTSALLYINIGIIAMPNLLDHNRDDFINVTID